MTLGLVNWFFLMMGFGVVWGIIDAWNEKAGFALFVLLVVIMIASLLGQSATAAQTNSDPVRIFVGCVGFLFGLSGGSVVYRNTFETADTTLEAQ